MDIFQAIATRRSVRKFTDRPVEKSVIEEIIDFAACAPSAGDAKPWKFVVLDRPGILEQASRINPYADAAERAPCGIVVCADLSMEKHKGFWVQDCSACTMTLLLAAHGKGLGAVWTGIYPVKTRVDAYRQILALPDHAMPLSLVLLGHPERRSSIPPARYRKTKVFYNIYGHDYFPDD